MSRTPDGLACQKKNEKKWLVWNVSTTIRLGGFKYVSLNVQPVVPWGNDPILTEHIF